MTEIIQVVRYVQSLNGVAIDMVRNTITFSKNGNRATITSLEAHGIAIDEVAINELEIDIDVLAFSIFEDKVDFVARVTRNHWTKPVVLFKDQVIYLPKEDKAYNFDNKEICAHIVSNNNYYFSLLEFLKTQEHQGNSAFYFVDYFNLDTRHIVFTSLKRDGKIEIPLPSAGIDLNEDVNLGYALREFKLAFQENNKHFPKFIKIELINELSKVSKAERVDYLLRKLDDIMYVASQNFEIYLHDLSLENLRQDFIEHKNKYFLLLRESLSKLTNQIIGLPIIISASVVGVYKISDSPITIFLIASVFIFYIFYTVYLLKLQREDIVDLKNTFVTDFNKLAGHSYFMKFPSDLNDFRLTKQNLDTRFKSIIGAIDLYFFFYSASSISLILYLEYQLGIKWNGIILSSIILFFAFIVIYKLTQSLVTRDEE